MSNRFVRTAIELITTVTVVVALGLGFGYAALANQSSVSLARQTGVGQVETTVEPTPSDSTTCLAQDLPLSSEIASVQFTSFARLAAEPEPTKVLCAGKIIDYTLEYDSTKKIIIVTLKGGDNFKGCKLEIKEPAPGWKPTPTGFEVPFDKQDVKVKVEGTFTCKKADGGEVVVPIDTLEFTFRPPNTFVLPLK